MEGFLKLGFFSMAEKITEALGGAFPYIVTGAVIVAIWIYFLLVVPKKQKRYDTITEYLLDVLNFRLMLGSGLAKILYIAFAIVILVIGFVAMFVANFFVGLLGTIILQIILRVIFEMFMLLFSIQENIILIKEENEAKYDYYDEVEKEEIQDFYTVDMDESPHTKNNPKGKTNKRNNMQDYFNDFK